eukprot:Phypoly_transcript_04422.p1 GENE.Phypoly_transcript_04422~~Phypoly_transcript_04422.p1  ORF type:complete len:426 (+),score=56.56 Phypoly_transcript_04422:908-2185(+)
MAVRVGIVGAGAAGLTSAIFAAQGGAKVIMIERTKEAGKKILMSGGSRCNVLPVKIDIQRDYFSSDPVLMKNIFSTWSLPQCYKWLASYVGLEMEKEEQSNKYFPKSQSSREVRDKLLAKCTELGVEVKYLWNVTSLQQRDHGWICRGKHNEQDEEIEVDRVVVCTGGLSFPLVGTDGTGHKIMESLGVEMQPTFPALTPLRGPHPGRIPLPGLSLNVSMSCNFHNKKVAAHRSGFLFTHRGFSGPAILDLSHHAVKALDLQQNSETPKIGLPKIVVNWADMSPQEWERELFGSPQQLVVDKISRFLPSRLAAALCTDLGISKIRIGVLREEQRKKLVNTLVNYPLPYDGHDGYKKAEVTGGGVKLSEIHMNSCESKKFPGLFLCGEIMDVFGRIGGFNFYWAWVSGRLAGKGAAKNVTKNKTTS